MKRLKESRFMQCSLLYIETELERRLSTFSVVEVGGRLVGGGGGGGRDAYLSRPRSAMSV